MQYYYIGSGTEFDQGELICSYSLEYDIRYDLVPDVFIEFDTYFISNTKTKSNSYCCWVDKMRIYRFYERWENTKCRRMLGSNTKN